jgi:hypothetical protein
VKFKPGDLVWISTPYGGAEVYEPPALIIDCYKDVPRVFLHNESENKRWLEEEDIGVGWVYDIVYKGSLETAVLGEWLRPWNPKC